MARDAGGRHRPRGLLAVVAFGLLQSLLVLAVGTALILGREDAEVRRELDADPGVLLAVGVVLLVVGLAGAALALLLARGSDRVRAFYGLVTGINVSVAVYTLVALRDVQAESLWSLVLPVGILWFLYGSRASQEYFER
jgi:hypothetical protein